MKTLLIPTDFKLKSLDCIAGLTQRYYPEKVKIVLVHMMKITDCAQELQMLSRRSAEYQHISQDFYNTCAQLKQKYANSINNIRVEFFYGSTLVVFKNFLEANEVDTIVMLENYDYAMLNKNSVDPALLVNRSGVQLLHMDCTQPQKPELVEAEETLIEERI
jgi:hypothetical protein